MRPAGRFDQSMSHQCAGRNNRVHDAAVDQVGDDQSLLGHGHGAGQRHHHETVFVHGHGLKHVGRLAQLPARERSLGHGTHQVVDRAHFREIQRLQRNQPVFDRVVQMAILPLATRDVFGARVA